jgi:small subunit ribosomal protein S3
MGQKVNPVGFRLGVIRDWNSTWYADSKNYAKTLLADIKSRDFLRKKLAGAGVSAIDIQRLAQSAKVSVHAARPGVIIGRSGSDVEQLRKELTKILSVPVHVNIEEIRRPELDAKLVAESVAQQLEKRIMFRRAMKRAVQNALRSGAKGIKIQVSGRLGGAEIARSEWYREGRVPLHTLRADIDYATGKALTTYGIIGVKVWIFKGEVLTAKGPDQKLSLNTEFDDVENKKHKKRSAKVTTESKVEKAPSTTVVKKKVGKVKAEPDTKA